MKDARFFVVGEITYIGPTEKRVSKAGKEYDIRTIEVDHTSNPDYPNVCQYSLFNKAAAYADPFKVGQMVELSCEVRGSQGRDGRKWTNINVFHLSLYQRANDTPAPPPKPAPVPDTAFEDLPF